VTGKRLSKREPTEPFHFSVRELAETDHKSVISLIQGLVQIPTRGGIDNYEPLVNLIEAWLSSRYLPTRRLHDPTISSTLGMVCRIEGRHPGPQYVLDACLDTAPFGDEAGWLYGPTSGQIKDGWLYGRGSADSKAAIAIFMHIATHMMHQADTLHGSLTLLFDADEHTGHFGGAKGYFGDPDVVDDIKGVMIGYPGIDQLVVGGRGFLRAELTVKGKAGHTGGQRSLENGNAIEGAAELVRSLSKYHSPGSIDSALGLRPKITVTGIRGGESFSTVPDHCVVDVDVRLTNLFDMDAARQLIERLATRVDQNRPSVEPTTIILHESWPAYITDKESPIRVALERAAAEPIRNPLTIKAAGPSNIGNYLAKLGIPATAGLGVRYEALHGTNECIDVATIPAVQATYHQAMLELLGPSK